MAEELNREAEKYKTIKTAQIEWSEKIKPEFIVEFIRYKTRENETLKNLRLYGNLIQTQGGLLNSLNSIWKITRFVPLSKVNDEVVVFTEPQKYRGIQGKCSLSLFLSLISD